MLVAGGVHDLDPELLITTAQAAMLLVCAVSGMAERKRSNGLPPTLEVGGPGTTRHARIYAYPEYRSGPEGPRCHSLGFSAHPLPEQVSVMLVASCDGARHLKMNSTGACILQNRICKIDCLV